MTQEFAEIFQLPVPERIQLVQDLWDSIAADAAAIPLTEWQKQELDRRAAAYARDPSLAVPWEEALQRIRARHGG